MTGVDTSGAAGLRPGSVRGASREEYRDLMCSFPTGVTVITSLDAAGRPCGMTCTSMTSVTLRPPTLLVCLRVGSATLEAVRSRGAFAVNLLHHRARRTAELFSSPVADRFERVLWKRSGTGLPWLAEDAFALADCRVTEDREMGDHAMVLGRVQQVTRAVDTPLLYGLRRFSTWDPAGHDPAHAARQAEENR
ncbi:flavin reductase family protein [Streptomyces sp. NPDC006971]|uniref:flavin reductase family protein n=2 Tax=Streptomyces TaxID=1883 RepID=UPI0033FE97BA